MHAKDELHCSSFACMQTSKFQTSLLSWDITKMPIKYDSIKNILKYFKNFANMLFWYFGYDWPCPSNLIVLTWRKNFMFIYMQKNQVHPSFPSWDIAKKLQTCYPGYSEHSWLWSTKTMVSGCRKFWFLS